MAIDETWREWARKDGKGRDYKGLREGGRFKTEQNKYGTFGGYVKKLSLYMALFSKQDETFKPRLNSDEMAVIRKSKTIKTAIQNEISIRNPQSQTK